MQSHFTSETQSHVEQLQPNQGSSRMEVDVPVLSKTGAVQWKEVLSTHHEGAGPYTVRSSERRTAVKGRSSQSSHAHPMRKAWCGCHTPHLLAAPAIATEKRRGCQPPQGDRRTQGTSKLKARANSPLEASTSLHMITRHTETDIGGQ